MLLDEHKRKKKAREAAANSSSPNQEKKEEEFTVREDRVATAGLDAIIRKYSSELAKAPPSDLAEEKKQKKLPPARTPVIPKDVKEDGVSSAD